MKAQRPDVSPPCTTNVECGEERLGDRRRSGQPNRVGHRHDLALVDRDRLGIGPATDDAHHPIAHRKLVDPLAHLPHGACVLHAWNLVIHRRAGIQAPALQQVGPVERGGGDVHHHFGGSGGRIRHLPNGQNLGASVRLEHNSTHVVDATGGGRREEGGTVVGSSTHGALCTKVEHNDPKETGAPGGAPVGEPGGGIPMSPLGQAAGAWPKQKCNEPVARCPPFYRAKSTPTVRNGPTLPTTQSAFCAVTGHLSPSASHPRGQRPTTWGNTPVQR